MVIDIKLFNDRRLEYYEKIIGKTLENETTTLKFNLTEEMKDKDFYIEFETPSGDKYSTAPLPIIEDEEGNLTVEYIIHNSLLAEAGELKCEVVLRKETEGETEEEKKIEVFKTYNLIFTILESINATESIPEQFPDVMTELFELVAKDKKTTDKHTEDIQRNYDSIVSLTSEVSKHESDIENLQINKANQGYVEDIERGLTELGETLNEIDRDLANAENDIEALQQDFSDQEESINHLADEFNNYYTKEESDKKIKGFATTSSLIAGINSCEPKMAETVDYVIETCFYGGGESGYRKYKNGLIEQWGVATTQANETEFTMHKPHIDQKFSVFVEIREQGNFYHYAIPSANQKFKCRIQSRDSQSMTIKFQWKSFGRWK